jgi:hypothetical protein
MSEETATTWNAPPEVYDTVRQLVANFHPNLALCVDEIAVIFKEKASKSGDTLIPGRTSKANKLLGILGDVDYKFIITIGHDAWEDLGTNKKQIAFLDHQLCWCRAEEKEPGGDCRFYISPPDVSFFREEVERHGFWRTSGEQPADDIIADLFGEDEPETE